MLSQIQRMRLSASFSLHSVLKRKRPLLLQEKKKKKGVRGMGRKGAPQDGQQVLKKKTVTMRFCHMWIPHNLCQELLSI